VAAISDKVSTPIQNGDGTNTAFAFDFSIIAPGDIGVYVDGVEKTYPGDYGVVFGDTSGTVTFHEAPAAGAQILLVSQPDYRQTSEFANQGAYNLSTVNTINRRAAIRDLVTEDKASRALKVPLGETPPEMRSLADGEGRILGIISGEIVPVANTSAAIAADLHRAENAADDAELERQLAEEARSLTQLDRQQVALDRIQTALDRIHTGVNVLKANTSAQQAAAAALVSGRIFATTAEALATVPDGETFLLIGSGDTLYTLYKNVGGVATSLGLTAPTTAVIDTLSALLSSGNAPDPNWIEWGQAEYGTVLWYRVIGLLVERAIQAETINATGMLTAAQATIGSYWTDATGAIATDIVELKVGEYGVAFWAMLGDGTELPARTGGGGGAEVLGYSDADRARRRPDGVSRLWQRNYVPVYGESTTVGAGGQNAKSLTPSPYNLMPSGGMKAAGSGLVGAWIPQIEDNNAEGGAGSDGAHGETTCYAMCATLNAYLFENYGIHPSTAQFCSNAPGQGGQKFSDLTFGSTYFNRLKASASSFVADAIAAEKSYGIPFVKVMIGANDAFAGTPQASIVTQAKQLAVDIDRELRLVTGQSLPIKTLLYQLSGAGSPTTTEPVQLGLLQAARESNLIELTTPWYDLPYRDGVHCFNDGYIFAGRKDGIHGGRYIMEGTTCACEAVAAWSYGQSVRVSFTEAVAIDSANLGLATQNGVKVVDALGNNAITDFAINEGDLILTLVRPLSGAWSVRIALDYLGTGLTVGQSGQGRSSNIRATIVHYHQSGGILTPIFRWVPHTLLAGITLEY
jgi:hypothetical protein